MTNRVNETDLAWLAGIVDGEGSIGIYFQGHKKGRRTCTTRLMLQNTSPSMVLRVKEIYESFGNKTQMTAYQKDSTAKVVYQVSISNKFIVRDVLIAILPYLVAKVYEAKIMLEFLERKCSKPYYYVTEDDMVIVRKFRLRDRGETLKEDVFPKATPSQATEDKGSVEGVETRDLSSNNNSPHERPTRKG